MSALARFSSSKAPPAAPTLHALGRGRRWRRASRFGAILATATLLSALGLAGGARLLAPRAAAGPASAGSAWVEIRRPIALFDLAGTDFAKLPATYQARRREADGAREDVMTYGRLGDDRPFLQVSLTRVGPPAGTGDEDLADALAQLAGARGLSATRIQPAAPVDTRLGPLDTAELVLWDSAGGTPCLGFRGDAHGGSVLRVAGFACGAPGRPLARGALACAVDRIDLVSAGDDAALRAVFVAAERRGGLSCLSGSGPISLLGPVRRSGWLDADGDPPPLRGLFEAGARQR
jgi:hypothetical protein